MSEQETFTEWLTPGPPVALAGLLGQDTSMVTDGFALPPLWHLVYLLERPAHSELEPEGHPVHGIPQPPSPGLRRMFAVLPGLYIDAAPVHLAVINGRF